jgi:hypothetical protein
MRGHPRKAPLHLKLGKKKPKNLSWKKIPMLRENRRWKKLIILPKEKNTIGGLSITPDQILPQVRPKREFRPRINPHEELL